MVSSNSDPGKVAGRVANLAARLQSWHGTARPRPHAIIENSWNLNVLYLDHQPPFSVFLSKQRSNGFQVIFCGSQDERGGGVLVQDPTPSIT